MIGGAENKLRIVEPDLQCQVGRRVGRELVLHRVAGGRDVDGAVHRSLSVVKSAGGIHLECFLAAVGLQQLDGLDAILALLLHSFLRGRGHPLVLGEELVDLVDVVWGHLLAPRRGGECSRLFLDQLDLSLHVLLCLRLLDGEGEQGGRSDDEDEEEDERDAVVDRQSLALRGLGRDRDGSRGGCLGRGDVVLTHLAASCAS